MLAEIALTVGLERESISKRGKLKNRNDRTFRIGLELARRGLGTMTAALLQFDQRLHAVTAKRFHGRALTPSRIWDGIGPWTTELGGEALPDAAPGEHAPT